MFGVQLQLRHLRWETCVLLVLLVLGVSFLTALASLFLIRLQEGLASFSAAAAAAAAVQHN